MRLLFWIVAIPVLAFAGAFAAANPGPLTLRLWPLSYELVMPVYAAVLGAFFGGFLIAALWFWIAGVPGRLARRRLVRHERELEAETDRLRRELAALHDAQTTLGGAQTGVATPEADARRRLIALSGD